MIKRTLPTIRLAIAAMLLFGLFPFGANGVAMAGSIPVLTIDPESGACGSQVTARGTGWPAGVPLVFQRGTDNGPEIAHGTVVANGTFAVRLVPCDASAPQPAGSQVQVIATPDKAVPGNHPNVRGTASFTVTSANCTTFPETGKTVCGRFLDYWKGHGGLAQQGFPISDEMVGTSDTDGKTYTMQYFERAVFEYHPEKQAPFQVLLSLLGAELYNIKYPGGAAGQQPNTSPSSQLFDKTGHRVGGTFLAYWQSHGGLPQQGYPVSDEFQEQSPIDGKTYTVQYFERAVFEAHPEKQAPYNVLLSLLGTLRFHDKYGAPAPGYPGLIAFDASAQGGPAGDISVINPDGTGRAKVATGHSPVFGPDGTHIAYLAVLSTQGLGQVAIRSSAINGQDRQDYCTTAGNAQLDLVSWSPRSRFIAMNAAQNPPGQIFLCNLSAKTLADATTAQGNASGVYDWTSDGNNAVWQAGLPPEGLQLYYGDPTQTAGAVRLTNGQNRLDQFGLKDYTSARVSPDGKTIAISGSGIFFLSVPGSQSPLNGKVLGGFSQPSSVSWSPDGRGIAVVDQATHVLSVVDIASGRITTLAANVGHADWSGRYAGGAVTGAVEGMVGYPASAVPASYVYAVEAGGSKSYRTQIQESAGQIPSFRIEGIQPGTYNVVAKPVTPVPGASPLCGGYSQFVTCGGTANCQDHSLIPVVVQAGQTTKGVQVQDWYVGTTFCPLTERVP